MKQWKCKRCGYIHKGDNPPTNCPICGAPASEFILIEDNEIELASDFVQEVDIAIVGSGASALTAAITAFNEGFKVAVFEKDNEFGGTSKRSGGRIWVPNNVKQKAASIQDSSEDALKYMVRLAYPEKYDAGLEYYGVDKLKYDRLKSYVDNASEMIEFLANNEVFKYDMDYSWKQKPYVDYVDHLPDNKGIRGRTVLTFDQDGNPGMGNVLIERLQTYLETKQVLMYVNAKVDDVVIENNKVKGIVVNNELVKVNKGVVFGSGGFSKNNDLMERFQQGTYYGGCASPGCEGDLVKIAEKHAIPLGHMNNAFRAQSMVDVYNHDHNGSSNLFYIIGDSVLEVNKYGKRVMNEKRNYNDRTMKHFVWDEDNAEFPNRLMYLIFDQRSADLWKGFPPMPIDDINESSYIIHGQDIDELVSKLELRLGDLGMLVGRYELDDNFTNNLKETIAKFNEYAKTGVDLEFGRGTTDYDNEYTTFPPTNPGNETWPPKDSKNPTMYPLSDQGPYYCIILGPGTLDTNGGPLTNEYGQMFNYNNELIEGLYGAGNCISGIGRSSYAGAGATLGPGMTYGYLAIKDIKAKESK